MYSNCEGWELICLFQTYLFVCLITELAQPPHTHHVHLIFASALSLPLAVPQGHSFSLCSRNAGPTECQSTHREAKMTSYRAVK